MRKISSSLSALIMAIAGWFFFQSYEIKGLDQVELVRRGGTSVGSGSDWTGGLAPPPPPKPGETIRIASFNIQVFGVDKLSKPLVMDKLAKIARNFDIIAIQEIRAQSDDVIPNFVTLINTGHQSGPDGQADAEPLHYSYVIGPRLGRTRSTEQYAFVFNQASIEVDRNQLYTVNDPDDMLHREPLVGWFRVRGPPPEQAFTFSLVNIHTDPDEVESEVSVLDDVMRVVANDGRNEDDVILLGDLNADNQHLGPLASMPGMTAAISGTPTNTRKTQQYDNILFLSQVTREFTGVSGVFDFMREFNLTEAEALEISDHLPVWAEFSVLEGGKLGQIAAAPGAGTLR